MDALLKTLYHDRIIDLERRQRDIRARRYQERQAGTLTPVQVRTLAVAYYIAHKEEARAREKLGYGAPRPIPPWVRDNTRDSLLDCVAFGRMGEGRP